MTTPTTGYQLFPPPQTPPRNGLGTAALVLGIIAVVLSFVPFVGLFTALPLGALAVTFGGIGMYRASAGTATNKGSAIAGVTLGTLALIVTIVITAAVSSTAPVTASGGSGNPALEDVQVTDCRVTNDFGMKFGQADVTLTNNTGTTQSYMVTISVGDGAGKRYGEINVFSNSLGAGQSTTFSGMAAQGNVDQGAPVGSATCTIASVDRMPL